MMVEVMVDDVLSHTTTKPMASWRNRPTTSIKALSGSWQGTLGYPDNVDLS